MEENEAVYITPVEEVQSQTTKQSILNRLRSNPELVQQGMALGQQALTAWQDNQRMSMELAHMQMQHTERIYEMTQRYALMRDTLAAVFGERFSALSAHYKVLEKGIEEGNNELLLGALQGICNIVTTNPLEKFEQFRAALKNPNSTIELDF